MPLVTVSYSELSELQFLKASLQPRKYRIGLHPYAYAVGTEKTAKEMGSLLENPEKAKKIDSVCSLTDGVLKNVWLIRSVSSVT